MAQATLLAFENGVTYAFFRWIVGHTTAPLVETAFENISYNKRGPTLHHPVVNELAALLRAIFEHEVEKLLPWATGLGAPIPGPTQGPYDPHEESPDDALWIRLLNIVQEDIDFEAVAEAILIRNGDWGNDRSGTVEWILPPINVTYVVADDEDTDIVETAKSDGK